MIDKITVQKTLWGEKRYHSLDFFLKQKYGQKVYKLSLNGGMSCPNRDGTIDTRGCIFCSEGGSGDFASSPLKTISSQIENAKNLVADKMTGNKTSSKFIAYFQAYTNTHGPINHLERIFTEAIQHPDILILSIATRPDCISDDVLALLSELNKIKPVWIELGLQTVHEKTAKLIRRGYPLSIFEVAIHKLQHHELNVIVHTILGLPGETRNDMIMTIEYINKLSIQGIKLQLLHILKGTDLANLYENGIYNDILSLEDYTDIIIESLERLPQDIIIHRITGDGPKKILLAPLWSGNKKKVLNHIHQQMKERNTWQGKYFST